MLVANWRGHRIQFCAIRIERYFAYPSDRVLVGAATFVAGAYAAVSFASWADKNPRYRTNPFVWYLISKPEFSMKCKKSK